MTVRALVVEDSEAIAQDVADILESLGHKSDLAMDQESARKLLGPDKYNYVLLDLEIPVKRGRLCRIENGKNLLAEIRETSGMESVPVIVMTAHGNDSPDLAVSVLKEGAVDYVKKPFTGGELDKAVREILGRSEQQTAGPARGRGRAARRKLAPFNADQRELVIHDDHVTVCGVTVWTESQHSHMRVMLTRLSAKERGRYVRINGTRLGRALGRNASNPVSRLIKEFRDRSSDLLAEHCGLECGLRDIIGSGGGGYHLKEWVDARVAGAEAKAAAPGAKATPAAPRKGAADPQFNERQAWILGQLRKGVHLRRPDIIRHTKKNRSTVNRDIKGLRDAGLIETHADGYYVASAGR